MSFYTPPQSRNGYTAADESATVSYSAGTDYSPRSPLSYTAWTDYDPRSPLSYVTGTDYSHGAAAGMDGTGDIHPREKEHNQQHTERVRYGRS